MRSAISNTPGDRFHVRQAVILLFTCLTLGACNSLPTIATDADYCCQQGTAGIRTYRVEFDDMPEFLKPMLRDEASIVLATKGLNYSEGDADALLRPKRALENAIRHFREDACSNPADCPYLDAGDSALAALPEHLRD